MTTAFELEHKFLNISLEKFEKYLNHETLNTIIEKELGFKSRKLISFTEEKEHKTWIFEVKKEANLPSAIKNMVSDGVITWQEESKLSLKDHTIHWKITPLSKSLKFNGEGMAKLKSIKNGCLRSMSGKITVSLPIIGKMIENVIVSELVKSYETEPQLQKKFYDSMP